MRLWLWVARGCGLRRCVLTVCRSDLDRLVWGRVRMVRELPRRRGSSHVPRLAGAGNSDPGATSGCLDGGPVARCRRGTASYRLGVG